MVRFDALENDVNYDSPRIRGDGPSTCNPVAGVSAFSPYSRGWSHAATFLKVISHILPVFAGMVPMSITTASTTPHSPRIRGDGPHVDNHGLHDAAFSPYSRGWSQRWRFSLMLVSILPVFAGMVPADLG